MRIRRSTSASHHSASRPAAPGVPSGRNAPVLTRRSVARRCSTESTTAPPSPSAAPASAAVKGPWVRA